MTDTSIEALKGLLDQVLKIIDNRGAPISVLADCIEAGNQYIAALAAANAAPAVTETTGRDWAEDSAHENGNYQCQCAVCGNAFRGHKRRMVCKSCAAPAGGQQEKAEPADAAPAHNLPDWSTCEAIIDNHEFRQRAAAGLEGQVLDTPPTTPKPTALHRFIYEYDDADPHRSSWFLHRLELVLNEVAAPLQAAQPGCVMVPVEPTEEMFVLGMEADCAGRPSVDDDRHVRSIWNAMINAAPGQADKDTSQNG